MIGSAAPPTPFSLHTHTHTHGHTHSLAGRQPPPPRGAFEGESPGRGEKQLLIIQQMAGAPTATDSASSSLTSLKSSRSPSLPAVQSAHFCLRRRPPCLPLRHQIGPGVKRSLMETVEGGGRILASWKELLKLNHPSSSSPPLPTNMPAKQRACKFQRNDARASSLKRDSG